MVITVECPSCASSFPVDPAKIPEGGVNARCSACAQVFRVEKPEPVVEPEPIAVEDVAAPEVEAEAAPEPEEEAEEPSSAGDGFQTMEAPEAAEDTGFSTMEAPESDGFSTMEAPEAEAPAVVDSPDDWVIETEDSGMMPSSEPAEEAYGSVVDDVPEVVSDDAFVVDDVEPAAEMPAIDEAEDMVVADVDEVEIVPEAPAVEVVPEVAPEPVADTPAPAEAAAAPVQGFTFGKRDPRDKAKRLARVLVSDMIMYNPDRHENALANGTLKADFEEEIDKSWKEYVEQVGPEMAEGDGQEFWRSALNDVLAKGEPLF